jgi:hypothetical protein
MNLRPFLSYGLILIVGLSLSVFFFRDVVVTHDKTFLWSWDASAQSYPWHSANLNAIRNGSIKLWDHTTSSGTSFVGEMQTAPFYPLTWLCALAPSSWDIYTLELLIAFHFAMAWVFSFVLIRHIGSSRTASFLAATVFAFTGAVAARSVGQPNIFQSLVYLPAVLYGCQRACENQVAWYKNMWIPLSGFVLSLMALAGHAQPAIHAGFATALWVLFKFWPKLAELLRGLGILMAIAFCAALFALPQIIALVEYMANAYRWIGADEPTRPPHAIPYGVFAFKYVFGKKELLSLWNPRESGHDGSTLFFTQVGIVFAMLGFKKWATPVGRYAAGMAVIAFLLGMGDSSALGRISYHLPLLKDIREPSRIACIFHLSACLLFALGIDQVREWLGQKRITTWILMAGATGLMAHEIDHYLRQYIHSKNTAQYPGRYYNQPIAETLRALTRENPEGPFRYIALPNDLLPPNQGNISGALSARGHRATMQIAYFDLLNQDWRPSGKTYSKLGLKYVVSKEAIPDFIKLDELEGLQLWERTDAAGVFQLDEGAGYETARLDSLKYTENGLVLRLKSHKGGTLSLGQPTYPGWIAKIDGKETNLIKKDGIMTLLLHADAQEISILYCPKWLWPSSIIALAAFTSLIFILGSHVRHRWQISPQAIDRHP